MARFIDILLTQRFVPEHGGSVRWMHEVYRRWPGPVRVITHDYYQHPLGTPEFTTTPPPPAGRRDHIDDANLTMDRRDIFLHNWGLERPGRWVRYGRMTRAVWGAMRSAPRDAVVRVHCVHAVPEAASLLPLRAVYGGRMRVICYAHGEEVNACDSSRQLRWLMRRAHRGIDLMLCNSRYTRDRLAPHLPEGRGGPRVEIVHPGVDVSEFDGAEEMGRRLRTERGWEGKLIVLTVGRLDPRKNQMAVVEAMGRLVTAGGNPGLKPSAWGGGEVVYVVAGDGRMMGALRERAASLGLADRVVLMGGVSGEVRRGLYGACDVFAMPAVREGADVEGFGLVFVEAGACGKAVVAGREGGQPEAVIDGHSGLVVDGRDVEALASALARLLSDAELRRSMGRAGRARAMELDWPRVLQRTVDLVEQLG